MPIPGRGLGQSAQYQGRTVSPGPSKNGRRRSTGRQPGKGGNIPGDGSEVPITQPACAVRRDVSDEERTALHEHFRAGSPRFASLYRQAVEPGLLRQLCAPACAGITADRWPRVLRAHQM